jgi:hypothetical protein
VNEGIRISNVTGDVTAETTNGDISIENAQSSSMDVSTVNGDVTFNGTVRDSGAYRITTHGGDIRVGLGGVANATVFVRTFQGDFTADFPIQLPDGQTARSGSKRFNFTLGSGSARIELQSFSGDILVARKTILTAEEARRIRRGQAPQPPQPPQPPPPPKAPKPPLFDLAHNGHFDWAPVDFDLDWTFEHDLDFDLDIDFDDEIDHIERHAMPPGAIPPPAPAAPPMIFRDLPMPPAAVAPLPPPPRRPRP